MSESAFSVGAYWAELADMTRRLAPVYEFMRLRSLSLATL